jgi:hypothetical protein
MNKVLGIGAAFGLSVVAGMSCGDGAGSASAFVQSYCDILKPCCAMAGLRSDGVSCNALLGAFASPSAYNKEAGSACLAGLRAAASKPDFCQTFGDSEPESCGDAFGNGPAGNKQPGEACEDDGDCARSSEGKVECQTTFVNSATVSKCQIRIKGKAGDQPCVGTVEGNVTSGNSGLEPPPRGYLCYISDGLRCDSTTDACVALKPVGEACTSSVADECVTSAYCDTTLRKCTERKQTGAMCTSSFSNPQCADGLYCSTTNRTCAAALADGAACTQNEQCKSTDCVNGSCGRDGGGDFGLTFICGSK